MKVSILIACALVVMSAAAFAQTEGRLSVGGSASLDSTTDSDVASTTTFGPVVRLNPKRGWGPAAALNWFRARLQNPAGGDGDFARLRVRPLMAGVSYTAGSGAVLTSVSIVAGPSFNKAEFNGSYVPSSGESLDAGPSLAVRPGVGVTWTVAPRVAIIGFGGYLYNRPSIVYRNASGQELRDHWKADAVVVSVGAVYSLF